MTTVSQDRLIRKEVALGTIRELPVAENHIGLSLIAPWREVQSDDVIFAYAAPDVSGLAPARAEDAESELAQKDDTFGTGRASIIDWAIKDHYSASDVSRYREYLRLAEIAAGGSFPLTVSSMTEDWQAKLARDTARRRRKLDNRIEWLIMSALETGAISYNDGKIKFSVDFGRPANQQDEAPNSTVEWDTGTGHDPINDLLAVQEFMYDTYAVRMGTVIMSPKALRYAAKADKFAQRAGIYNVVGGTVANADPNYVVDGWGPEAVRRILEAQTGLTIVTYDSVYRTRAIGSTTFTLNRYIDESKLIFLPNMGDISEIVNDSEIGFASTLTSPHPEGMWTPGFYEWEQDTKDPWGHDMGTGVKAFPVFPHMELTYVMQAWT